jgi:hypothetical protein
LPWKRSRKSRRKHCPIVGDGARVCRIPPCDRPSVLLGSQPLERRSQRLSTPEHPFGLLCRGMAAGRGRRRAHNGPHSWNSARTLIHPARSVRARSSGLVRGPTSNQAPARPLTLVAPSPCVGQTSAPIEFASEVGMISIRGGCRIALSRPSYAADQAHVFVIGMQIVASVGPYGKYRCIMSKDGRRVIYCCAKGTSRAILRIQVKEDDDRSNQTDWLLRGHLQATFY